MYESPITIIEQVNEQLVANLNLQIENEIMRVVKSFGVNIDKEELIKLLNNDRNQYHKGYVDGIKDFAEAYKDQIKNYTGMFSDEGFYVSHSSVLSAVDFICERMGVRVDE